ncbi:hypothetical protein GLAREA_04438 [Glarea lozoyensis ATCC 20868]|uniref:F-box domain-containing protein n=1 Tax=Glarea lozoyensis (strain ATCC 20868 / MF5171) TaxID=1116229 RepID=S3CMA1_GLAL2|nr:uncharacterized protein GLAREA_04438 [Glarea lozoyensis ATCC 20868]EPE27647.1 hypothetical protein GLAREA_04438 [Glarea lozoyensis ATCC 20868]
MGLKQFIEQCILNRLKGSRVKTNMPTSDPPLPMDDLLQPSGHLQPLPPFLKIPNELFFLITSYLPDEYVMSLGLTCRTLYSSLEEHYFQPTKKADIEVLRKFLPLVDRDSSTHLYCQKCVKIDSISCDAYPPFLGPHDLESPHIPGNERLQCWNGAREWDVKNEI